MRYVLLAACVMGTTSFSPITTNGQEAPQEICMMRVANYTQIPLRVVLQHGDVFIRYKEVVEYKQVFDINVPCKSEPVRLAVVNVNDQTDFQTRVFDVPPPGMVQVWCLGPRSECESYRESNYGTYNNRKKIT